MRDQNVVLRDDLEPRFSVGYTLAVKSTYLVAISSLETPLDEYQTTGNRYCEESARSWTLSRQALV